MSNVYVDLIRLLPGVEKTAGKIVSIDTTRNIAVLLAIGGGNFIADIGKGSTYVIGDWVLVKDNVIVSTIPVPEGTGLETATEIVIY